MIPIYVDIHIHTSENPNELKNNYDVETLLRKVEAIAEKDYLIGLSDHNTINKKAYLDLLGLTDRVILAVEIHILNYPDREPYHCHILFDNNPITAEVINDINGILDSLYPNKVVKKGQADVPTIHKVVNSFDKYNFLLLPHGGQSHHTFNKSIPEGVVFDTTLERSIYYNQFDGFTARSNDGLEETQKYFYRLGIKGFVNLLTCSDNYKPSVYPQSKSEEAGVFRPTWMFAMPTFDGLRLSLSEASRFAYSETKPKKWSEYISKVKLEKDNISINVELTPGLNVVIGGSSSGKTLFVDSLYRKINKDFSESAYDNFGVDDIVVVNTAGIVPHYISQNFIVATLMQKEQDISQISIIDKVFPLDTEIDNKIQLALEGLKRDINVLINCAKEIESIGQDLGKIPILSSLIIKGEVKGNIIASFLPNPDIKMSITLLDTRYKEFISNIKSIESFIQSNPFCKDVSNEIEAIRSEVELAYKMSEFERVVYDVVNRRKNIVNEQLKHEDIEKQSKKHNLESLYKKVQEYAHNYSLFCRTLNNIAKYDESCATKSLVVVGHELSVENEFSLSKEEVLNVINKFLKAKNRIEDFSDITPESLFLHRFMKKAPNVDSYDAAKKCIFNEFEKANKKTYKIITKDGRAFDSLSPGWKSAVLLDIILGYSDDIAPLIIDQPEDNLATNFINTDLVESIKRMKGLKQIILVSHNATIPMIGDAQNIVLCKNENGKIVIRSKPLEGHIDKRSMVDFIAEITDGGKASIKKRVKKYNLKSFRGN